jgi:hypothetical protein
VRASVRSGSPSPNAPSRSGMSGPIAKNPVPRVLATALVILTYLACASSAASADVDMTGSLVKVTSSSLRSSLGTVTPQSVTSESGNWRCFDPYSTVANWPYYYAIGNCPKAAELEVVSYASEDPATHEHSYGGFVNGAFSGCGWINTAFPLERLNVNKHTACAEEAGGGFRVQESSFWEKLNSTSAQDGYYVVNKSPCPEYANYRPWSTSNVEKELIRTVPAYEREGSGEKASNPALKWRYTTKYASTDGTGRYVMVRDDRISGGEGNWVFVPRSCLPATLPTGESERLPPAPSVTTDGASGVATPNATLNATVNPNGVETKYFFEYGTTTNYGSSTSVSSAGAGTSSVPVDAALSGLAPGTTYYFRIVASSAIGESVGGAVAFTTQAPPAVTTIAASSITTAQATLNGSVNPNGLNTKYRFEYGTTESYGSSTATGETGVVSGALPETAPIADLIPGTTYYFRIMASSSAGTSYGSDQQFTTVPDPRASAVLESNGDQEVFFRGTNGLIDELFYNGTWHLYGVGGSPSAGAVPAAVLLSNGDQAVFFRSTNGDIEELLDSGGWKTYGLGGSPATVEGDTEQR